MPKLSRGRDEVTRKASNLTEYLRLKDIRSMTGLIGGRIYYNGQFWDENDYNEVFPLPKLEYDVERIDGRQLG